MKRQEEHRFEGEGIRRLLFASTQDFTKKRKEEPGIAFHAKPQQGLFVYDIEEDHDLVERFPAETWDSWNNGWSGLAAHAESGRLFQLLDGVGLIWKRCHSWGNTVGEHQAAQVLETYCPAPYDQLVIQWNGDVVACCTDYEGRTKHSNVFRDSLEQIWHGPTLEARKRDMLEGRLLDVCARCIGLKA